MDRFVSKGSSSSVDLDSSSRDDVWAERAAIALSVGLSCPPDRSTKQTRGRPSWHGSSSWNALFRATSSTTTSFRMVSACSALSGGDHEKPSTGSSHTRSSPTHEELAHTKTPRAATAAPATYAAALDEDEPSGSGSKRRKVQVDTIARDWVTIRSLEHEWFDAEELDAPSQPEMGPAALAWHALSHKKPALKEFHRLLSSCAGSWTSTQSALTASLTSTRRLASSSQCNRSGGAAVA